MQQDSLPPAIRSDKLYGLRLENTTILALISLQEALSDLESMGSCFLRLGATALSISGLRNSIDDGLKSIAIIGTQEKTIDWINGSDEKWDTPDVALSVVDADCENGMVALDDFFGSEERIVLGTFDIHFDQATRLFGEKFVEGDAWDIYSDVLNFGGEIATHAKSKDGALCTDRTIQQMNFLCRLRGECGRDRNSISASRWSRLRWSGSP